MEVLSGPLENDRRYCGFTDLISSVPLMRGRGAAASQVGEFKVSARGGTLANLSARGAFANWSLRCA